MKQLTLGEMSRVRGTMACLREAMLEWQGPWVDSGSGSDLRQEPDATPMCDLSHFDGGISERICMGEEKVIVCRRHGVEDFLRVGNLTCNIWTDPGSRENSGRKQGLAIAPKVCPVALLLIHFLQVALTP